MLTDLDLRNIASAYELNLNGIHMKDQLPDLLNPGWYIINMQSSRNGNGTHWVCLLYDDRETTYFDSFGFPPPFEVSCHVAHSKQPEEYLTNFEIKNAIQIWNDNQIQDLMDDNCGLYCIACICFFKSLGDVSNRKKMRAFQKLFSHDTLINTSILTKFLKEYKNTYVLDEEEF